MVTDPLPEASRRSSFQAQKRTNRPAAPDYARENAYAWTPSNSGNRNTSGVPGPPAAILTGNDASMHSSARITASS